jgi:hypothetical protein
MSTDEKEKIGLMAQKSKMKNKNFIKRKVFRGTQKVQKNRN